MDSQGIIDQIVLLSEQDDKDITGKTLKTQEEVGELAKYVLPFVNSSGTLHRFVSKNNVLEEAVDTILSAGSIIADLVAKYDVTEDEVSSMFIKKLGKWGEIQHKESGVDKEKIPFEIHVTVQIVNTHQIDMFQHLCEEINVKPILLDLHSSDVVIKDMMTSSTLFGNNADALFEMERICRFLSAHGFVIQRKKIETVPWHPAAPIDEQDMPTNCYFESHLGVIVNDEEKVKLVQIAEHHDLHISRNAFKKLEDDRYVIMATKRSYDMSRSAFEAEVAKCKQVLELRDFTIEREIIEFSVYDSNISHDFLWLNPDEHKTNEA